MWWWCFVFLSMLAVVVLVLLSLYMLQSHYRSGQISAQASLKVVTCGTTTLQEPKIESTQKNWKELINEIETKSVSNQNFSMNTLTKTPIPTSMYVHSGLPKQTGEKDIVVLYSSGDFAGFLTDYPRIRQKLPWSGVYSLKMPMDSVREGMFKNVPVVGFDYPTHSPRLLNFGQVQDQQTLTKLFDDICTACPTARIVLMGECMGGLRIYNWIPTMTEQQKERVCAIIYMYPIRKMDCIFKNLPMYKPIQSAVHGIIKKALKHYTPEDHYPGWFMNRPVSEFPACPMLLATGHDDPFAKKEELIAIADKFRGHSKPLQIYESPTKVGHGKLRKDTGFLMAVDEFMEKIH